jgi:hypothetical protein
MKVKGMRDVRTIHGIGKSAMPRTRAQAVVELAHLEHEKARLERELGLWMLNQKRAQSCLQMAQERMALLKRYLEESPDTPGTNLLDSMSETHLRRAKTWREISLEY